MIHKTLNIKEWQGKSLAFQLANIGSEAQRVYQWQDCGDKINANKALDRFLELLDMTIEGQTSQAQKRELLCLKEYFIKNIIQSYNKAKYVPIKNYFLDFAILSRM